MKRLRTRTRVGYSLVMAWSCRCCCCCHYRCCSISSSRSDRRQLVAWLLQVFHNIKPICIECVCCAADDIIVLFFSVLFCSLYILIQTVSHCAVRMLSKCSHSWIQQMRRKKREMKQKQIHNKINKEFCCI